MIWPAASDINAEDVLSFWFEETQSLQWYRRDARFDHAITLRFGQMHRAANDGTLDVWRAKPRNALARIIILDQFSRNIFRDNARAFASDDLALTAARDALQRRFDLLFPPREQAFFLMPFMHAEALADQQLSVQHFKTRQPAAANLSFAIEHRDIVARFGRFPHRNKVLGRQSSPQEIQYLNSGGFNP